MSKSPLASHYDVVIAGGRVAGTATAIGLGRAGYRVLLVERQSMPSDTISTHILWPDGIAALDRLGLLDAVLATDAPIAHHFRLCLGEESIATPLIPLHGYDYLLCVRRIYLDGILWEAASTTPGVTALDRTMVIAVHTQDGRVTGVRLRSGSSEYDVLCDLVVGADGRHSYVARSLDAGEEDVVPPGLFWYYGYFKHASPPDPPEFTQSGAETDMIGTFPTNDRLLMVIYGARIEEFDAFRHDHRVQFLSRLHNHPWVSRMVAGATLATPIYGINGVRGYYRTAFGPGWVLVGDALHQKDPLVARGINDALLEAEWLAEALRDGVRDDQLEWYATTARERTRTNALSARMQSRPDRYMTEAQAEHLAAELTTSEGLARFVLLEYSDELTFDEYFGTTGLN